MILSLSIFPGFRWKVTYHLRLWLHASFHCPGLHVFLSLSFIILHPPVDWTWILQHGLGLSFLLSHPLTLTVVSAIWRTLWPESTALGSTDSLNLYPSDSYNYIKLQVSQIYELINRSEDPLLTYFDWVDVDFSSDHIGLRASHKNPPHNAIFLSLSGENWKLSHLLQVFSQFSPMLSNVRHLTVYYSRVPYQTPTNLDWMQLLVAFSALRTVDLYGGHKLLECVDGETAARLLPDLDLLYIEGRLVSSVSKFCAARRV